ncbi:transposase [Methylocystis parvus]|uniref:Transposase n=1 Tax=Methylocystis parvus TaxID=134 RepID=A0A6B8M4Y7_9HYPH|nr:transposase [Methylocystis parvus]QGN00058.1 transposase [Methylocystis parvus]WBK02443.1 transposase [Methylocystis parvus OBBP]
MRRTRYRTRHPLSLRRPKGRAQNLRKASSRLSVGFRPLPQTTPFETLLDIGPDIRPRAIICDKGYASKANREAARRRGIAPVIPHKANEKNRPAFFARTLYKARARIEHGFGRLKRFGACPAIGMLGTTRAGHETAIALRSKLHAHA